MTKDLRNRFLAMLLAVSTVAAVAFSWINYQKEREYTAPYDGVWWVESGSTLRAERIYTDDPGGNAGIKQGDLLVKINGQKIQNAADLARQLYRTGIWSKATYELSRDGVPLEVSVILAPADRSLNNGLRFIALIYLGIGLYVLLRRWTAPRSAHFYVFCLVSFVFYSFKYTGKLNAFDWTVYWANVVAWLLQPALFLHFALTFPEKRETVKRHPWVVPALYLPGLLIFSVNLLVLTMYPAKESLRWNMDRLQMSYLAAYFLVASAVLWFSYQRATTPLLRQQMKWVTRGTILSVAPFTLFYVIPFLAGLQPSSALRVIAVLSLVFLPLTFGYAIVRYRLMDVDIIFKRGMAYTLATACIVGLYFGAIGLAAQVIQTNIPSVGTTGLVVAIAITALLFDPFRNYIQEHIDRFFYRKRYDYRKTLIEFGRDLNSETDLDKLLTSVVDRLSRTLLVDRLAIFLNTGRAEDPFLLAKSYSISYSGQLNLDFLRADREEFAAGHLFFDNTHQVLRESPGAQKTIAELDLNYYIPCTVQNRMLAVLGLGKTTAGDFLSSEDVELLETLAGYLGIAIQNAGLYASLEQKVQQYERLKEFSENIVESINVGILAVDLADRVESWNSQMEVMFAMPRAQVIGRRISEIFPAAFIEEFYRVRQLPGVHNLYKFRLGTPAGDRTANIAIAPLVTKDFSVAGRVVIVDDMTERIELESQLSQAEKLSSIGMLAAGVAHEVNTPLAVISSYAQMLSKQVQGDEKQAALLDKITKQTFRASEIVNSLLNFSRTHGTEFNEVNVNKVIEDTLTLLEHQFKTSRVKVQAALDRDLPPIFGNAGKLQQVFLNLFLNAKDAMPSGGTLHVTTANGAGVNVSIRDTGTGIAQEHIQKIYDPFFTTKNTPNDNGRRGTGLGLSVTYGIIQEHAGKIRVESAVGEGTSFHLEFPMIRKGVHV